MKVCEGLNDMRNDVRKSPTRGRLSRGLEMETPTGPISCYPFSAPLLVYAPGIVKLRDQDLMVRSMHEGAGAEEPTPGSHGPAVCPHRRTEPAECRTARSESAKTRFAPIRRCLGLARRKRTALLDRPQSHMRAPSGSLDGRLNPWMGGMWLNPLRSVLFTNGRSPDLWTLEK